MLPLLVVNAVWNTTDMYRLGAEYRTSENRFFHIDKLGWFVHLRGEFTATAGMTSRSSIAGPFPSQEKANAYLQYTIHQSQLTSTGND